VQNMDNKSLYVAQFSLIVLAPVLMAAACYIVFVGRQFSRLMWVGSN
jgi:hypothetical protein